MKKIVLVAVVLASFAMLLAGCGGGGGSDDKNPFKGTWRILEVGLDVTFSDKTFSITVPDFGSFSGPYSYQGDYPDFVATITVEGQASVVNVHFNSEDQFRACESGTSNCAIFNKL